MKDIYLYFTGQSQWMPNWLYRLPDFFRPVYQGESEFKWLGVTISVESAFIGDTLFMHWRREILKHRGIDGGGRKKRQIINTYTCAMCGKTFEKGRTDDEAILELHELFGDIPLDECDIVCDDCFEQIRPD